MKSRLPSPLAFDEWPELDRRRWQAAISGDPLQPGGGGGGSKWRPATRHFNERGYGGWLSWLQASGELDAGVSPASRATVQRVRTYLEALVSAGLAGYSRAGRLQAFSDALRVMEPECSVPFIGRAAGRISASAERARDLRPRLRPPEDVLQLGFELMGREEAGEDLTDVKRAIDFRDGLLIALWACRPLRIANLGGIEIGRSLVRDSKGYRLQFDASEMKAGRPFSCGWPRPLCHHLARYLEHHRPLLLSRSRSGSDHPGLWASQHGRAMTCASVGQIIRIRTKAAFGAAVNPHLMRYMVATRVAEHQPEQIADVAAILGHASLDTSERHYIMAGSFSAAVRFQSAMSARALSGRRRG